MYASPQRLFHTKNTSHSALFHSIKTPSSDTPPRPIVDKVERRSNLFLWVQAFISIHFGFSITILFIILFDKDLCDPELSSRCHWRGTVAHNSSPGFSRVTTCATSGNGWRHCTLSRAHGCGQCPQPQIC